MPLTPAQLQTLKTDIAGNSNTVEYPAGVQTAISALPNHPDANTAIANWYNANATPDFWVWRTRVSKAELVGTVGPEGTTFSWTGTGFITRTQGERDAWRELFNGTGFCNPSIASVRQAFQDIFSGAVSPAPENRTHLAAVGRRKANRVEKLFATGTGSTGNPATMSVTAEGTITYQIVQTARELP